MLVFDTAAWPVLSQFPLNGNIMKTTLSHTAYLRFFAATVDENEISTSKATKNRQFPLDL